LKDLRFATFTFENNSQGKFMLSIIFGYSKYYVDSLSENVRRGNRTKIQHGWMPGMAPLGYLNDKEAKTIVVDPERFPLVQQMWRLMLTGAYPPRRIWEIATGNWKLRTVQRKRIGGKLISLSAVYRILTNPFYSGVLELDGKVIPGKHEPMVTIDEFEKVQSLLRKPGRPRETREFAYTGMIRCGECGFSVTGEEKINRYGYHYTYYHCTKRRLDLRCGQPYVSLASLERQIVGFLEEIQLPDRFHRWALARLESKEVGAKEDKAAQMDSLRRSQAAVVKELQNLTHIRIRDLITDEDYLREKQERERQQIGLAQQLKNLETADSRFEPAKALVSLNNRLVSRFQAGDLEKKRLILTIVGSNLALTDHKLNIDVKKPFRRWTKSAGFSDLRAFVRDIRTFLFGQSPEALDKIQELLKRPERVSA
jgi:hypothetical protein